MQVESKKELQYELLAIENEERDLSANYESLIGNVRSIAEQLKIYIDEIPGTDNLAADLNNTSFAYRQNIDHSQYLQGILVLLGLVDQLHYEAQHVLVQSCEIRTAQGRLEKVLLLNVGHIAFAYQTDIDKRIGFAVSSPADASGYRWSEDLSRQLQDQFHTVIQDLQTGDKSLLSIPVDISQQLHLANSSAQEGLIGLLRSGGFIMFPLAIIAVLALLLILERAWVFWRQRSNPQKIAAILDACRQERFADAEASCRQQNGLLARTLTACLGRRQDGQAAMEDSIQEQLMLELPRLQKRLGGIAVLGAVAPLLGLLGTVTGIIQTFGVIKVFGNSNPGLMAGGISEALVTTASGLVIAIPILLLHSMLQGRLELLLSDAEKNAACMLNLLTKNGGDKK